MPTSYADRKRRGNAKGKALKTVTKATRKTTTPWCRKCGRGIEALVVDGATQRLKKNGKRRRCAHTVCQHCGNEWWSVNKYLLDASDEVDRNRKAGKPKADWADDERNIPVVGRDVL